MAAFRNLTAMLLTGLLGALTQAIPASAATSTEHSSASAPSVSCAPMKLIDPSNGRLAVPSGEPLRTTATLGNVDATLSGTATMAPSPLIQPALADPEIQIEVGKTRVLSAPVDYPKSTRGSLFVPGTIGPIGAPIWSSFTSDTVLNGADAQVPLCVARFGGPQRETAVLLATYTGGNHCCTGIDAYVLGSGTSAPVQLVENIGNPLAGVIESDGHAVIVTADNSFEYQFQSFAGSGTPLRVLEIRGNKFVSTTVEHLDWVSADGGYWWALFTDSQAGQGLGALAAWVADECTLGNGAQAFNTLAQLEADGSLDSRYAGWPSGADFVSELRSFLAAHGYCLVAPTDAVTAAVMTAAPSSGHAAKGALPQVLVCSGNAPALRPSSLHWCTSLCSSYVTAIHWQHWTAHGATGVGVRMTNNGVPDCAHGTWTAHPGYRVTLSHPAVVSYCAGGQPAKALLFTSASMFKGVRLPVPVPCPYL